MKDHFSSQSDQYARYRPTYPPALYEFIALTAQGFEKAWDCGTGNGQVAIELVRYFQQVYATDISEPQLKNALPHERILYTQQPAEKTNFQDSFFDLVIVAQAVHWFDVEAFYLEVNRVLKDQGILVITGYGKIQVSPEVDEIIDDLYSNIVGPFWDKERRYVDENYQTIPFPLKEIPSPEIENYFNWSLEQLTGYLGTWSAVQHFIKQRGYDPVKRMVPQLTEAWGNAGTKGITFPLLLRTGKK